jgi:hypothetical protein
MIVAGEYIDLTLGVTLGISTMAAAALGTLVSVVFLNYIKGTSHEIGFKNFDKKLQNLA